MKLLNEFGITNVTVTGDTRFDRVLDVRKQARELPFIERFLESKEGKRPIVMVAGSSWPQDEAIFIPYFHEHPEMKLIIAPHEIHREHLLSIEAMLKRPSVRLSEAHEDDLADKDCLIIDSFGLLSSIIAMDRSLISVVVSERVSTTRWKPPFMGCRSYSVRDTISLRRRRI